MTPTFGLLTLLAAEGGKAETPSSWWPEPYEMIWGSIATVAIAYALWRFAVPQLRTALTARTERIQRDLDNAAKALIDAKASAVQIRADKGDLAAERTRRLAEADRSAECVLAEGRARIEAEVVEAHAKGEADIAIARNRVQTELTADVVAISTVATEDVVRLSLDDETQQRLIEDFISKVGASR